ncbi:Coatomer, beta' subunit [Nadsonia fulvescens var. elongata DSM 6958]|uniref:Coatomer subunit beta' n=1 Tax=Nadsonia fulvescens var. elongata DSM 6958 TaxID=857566 RepID=A0A1E3PP70_9ASCO|nr:Coatomer, beta' subunit [Nadsonia fulvescens var. elongata DSM 6958]
MRLDVKKQSLSRTDRVKGIDFHPTEPWVLTTLYSGKAQIWSFETNSLIKTIDISDVPARAGRFIARKNWIVIGSDDFQIRVYNYNTGEKVTQFEAHPDYIRAIVVHPSQPFILSTGDDMTIKLWNWEHGWKNTKTYEGHSHYVMYLAINPKDPNTFASACLDRTVKIWSFSSPTPNFTLEAHETKGVNFVEYYPQSDKPYLITSSDDRTVKVWDYQTKSCVATMEGHGHNVSFALFHPELPIIISGSEDSSIKIWNANTYKLEQTLNYGLDRAWCASVRPGSNMVAIGFDAGNVILQLGKEEPSISMDPSGKLIWAKNNDIFSSVVKGNDSIKDGEVLPLAQKELGSVEVYPTQLTHSPNGRFVAVTGDGEYIIYTALAWRNKSFGSALEFVWAQDSNEYAIRENANSVRVFKNFKERNSGHVKFNFSAENIFGGTLLGIKGDGFVGLYDWESGNLVRRIDVDPVNIYWSDSGELVSIVCEDSFYILRFDREAFSQAFQNGTNDQDEGVEDAFEVIHDVTDTVKSGSWVGDCFIYTTSFNRLNYLVGGETYTISHFDKQMYLLGYIPRDNVVYLADKDVNVTSYELSLSVIEFQTVVLRGDMEQAQELLEDIPVNERSKIARFLESQGHSDLALEISTDAEHKFDLAVALNDLTIAVDIAKELDNESKWKSLGDASLNAWNISLAETCFKAANDLESLVLIYTSTGSKDGLKYVAEKAMELGKYNVAFSARWAVRDIQGCVELLAKTGRFSEAAILALTYNQEPNVAVEQWKADLVKSGKPKIADLICTPSEDADKFPAPIAAPSAPDSGTTEADLIDISEPVVESDASISAEEELPQAENLNVQDLDGSENDYQEFEEAQQEVEAVADEDTKADDEDLI